MSKKYQPICDDIAEKLKNNVEVIYTGEDIIKFDGELLPKSYEDKSYLNSDRNPIGRCLNENDAIAEYIPAKLIIKRKSK